MKNPGGIKGWPEEERPRERLAAKGPSALSDAELLALLLRTGSRGRSAVDVGREILRRFGSLPGLAQRLPKEFAGVAGVGAAKAAALAAALELGRRALSGRATLRAAFRSSADVAAHFLPLCRGLKREVFRIVLVDGAHRVIKVRTVTVGSLTLALVHPREVFREAIVENAAAVILVHNHPGGDPSPSPEDATLTAQLVRAGETVGIRVLDHLVIGADRFYSFADARKLNA